MLAARSARASTWWSPCSCCSSSRASSSQSSPSCARCVRQPASTAGQVRLAAIKLVLWIQVSTMSTRAASAEGLHRRRVRRRPPQRWPPPRWRSRSGRPGWHRGGQPGRGRHRHQPHHRHEHAVARRELCRASRFFEKPYALGDIVVSAGQGQGHEHRPRLHHVEPDGNNVWVPNMKAPMTNYSTIGRSRIDVDLQLLPSVAMDEVRGHMLGALQRCAVVLPEPAPAILLKDVTQTALVVTARVWCRPARPSAPTSPCASAHAELTAQPFATWRVQVGRTLEHLEGLGYPGIEPTRSTPRPCARGSGPPARRRRRLRRHPHDRRAVNDEARFRAILICDGADVPAIKSFTVVPHCHFETLVNVPSISTEDRNRAIAVSVLERSCRFQTKKCSNLRRATRAKSPPTELATLAEAG